MQRFYLVPVNEVSGEFGNARLPKYFANARFGVTGIVCRRSNMDYGFFPYFLTLCHDITPADDVLLTANVDVYAFPSGTIALNSPITDRATIDVFFENINIPTNWLTPSTTYLELLRRLAGMFQFNQRYGEFSGGQTFLYFGALDDRPRDLTAQQEQWLRDTANSFVPGSGASINRNQTIRTLLRNVSSYWDGIPFKLGGVEF